MGHDCQQESRPCVIPKGYLFLFTISFGNEYGQMSRIVIYGVEILNEGTGFSIDNVTSEKACTFVARRVDTMRAVTSNGSITNSLYTTSS